MAQFLDQLKLEYPMEGNERGKIKPTLMKTSSQPSTVHTILDQK
jgi:hypothetical protein